MNKKLLITKKPILQIVEEWQNEVSYRTLDQMAPCVLNAVINLEDSLFFHHPGFLLLSIINALRENQRQKKIVRGGSTITQQLAKNLYLFHERTYARKALELILALYIEYRLTKQEILELYMNVVYWGEQCYGIEEACQYYFGQSVSDITLNQAITLACMLPAPAGKNNPFIEKGKQTFYIWRDRVLLGMARLGVIPKEEIDIFRDIACDVSFDGAYNTEHQKKRYQKYIDRMTVGEFWSKLKRKIRLLLWKIQSNQICKRRKDQMVGAEEKCLKLVFVDGPSANTPALLELLEKYHIRATFYVKGPLCDVYESTIRERGHQVYNESYRGSEGDIHTSIWLIVEDPAKVYQETINALQSNENPVLVQQDIYRDDNFLTERLILWARENRYTIGYCNGPRFATLPGVPNCHPVE